MLLNIGRLAFRPRRVRRGRVLTLRGFPHGVNTSLPSSQLISTEMARCVNWKINKRGQLETRSSIVRYTDTAVGAIKSMSDAYVGTTTYKLLTDSNNKLYYLNGLTPTLIGTLENETEIIPYNGYAILLDGSYIKYIDSVNSIKIAYDDGTGTSGYQFDYTSGEDDGTLQVGNGVNSKIAQKFTTQSWDSGYTIPPTTISVYLTRQGRPTGDVNVVIRTLDETDYTVLGTTLATKLISEASELTSVSTKYDTTFTSGDITTEMSPGTNYYCSIEFDNSDGDIKTVTAISQANPGIVDCVGHGYSVGDVVAFFDLTEMTELNGTSQTVSSVIDDDHFAINDTSGYGAAETTGGNCVQKKASDNYVEVHSNTVSSGGKSFYYDGWWNSDTTKNCLMSLRPGRPPKGKFGVVWKERLFVAGDPDNPGYVWFSNLSQFDWSTSDGGGYIGAIDNNSNSFSVGGIADIFGDLYVYGTEAQPYLSKLTGSSPSGYSLPKLYQRTWTLHKTLQSSVNDLWTANSSGVDALSGVQEYGDVRTFSYSDPIKDRIDDYWSNNAIAGYYPNDGQYWLYLPGHHRVLVCHTKNPIQEIDKIRVRYPWTEFEFCKGYYDSRYTWGTSSSGTNEYYLIPYLENDDYYSDTVGNFYTDETGSDYYAQESLGIDSKPDYITLDNKKITEGTLGSLDDHQWAYGDNDNLGYNTVYIRDDSGDPGTTGIDVRNVLAPTSFGVLNNEFVVGSSDGYVYKTDSSEYKDLTTEKIYFDIISPYLVFPMIHVNLDKYQVNLVSKGGALADISFYIDEFQNSSEYSFTKSLIPDDRLTVSDLIMDVNDAIFQVDTTTARKANPLWEDINLNARSIQIRIDNVVLSGYPLYLNEQMLRYRGLSY